MFNFRLLAGSLLAIALVACKDTLVVDNVNDPDRLRALSRPGDIEAFIGSTYAQIHNATLGGSNDDLQTQLQVMGMENTSSLANFAMSPRRDSPHANRQYARRHGQRRQLPRLPGAAARGTDGGVGRRRDESREGVVYSAAGSAGSFVRPVRRRCGVWKRGARVRFRINSGR